jgi:hypothetical protein
MMTNNHDPSPKQSGMILLAQLAFPLLYAGLFYLFSLTADSGRWLEVTLLLSGLYLGVGLYLADKPFLSTFYLEKGQHGPLMSRSTLLALVLVPLGIFVITSTGSHLSVGVYLGLFGALVWHMLFVSSDSQAFGREFLSQVKRKFSPTETNWYIGGLALVFLVFSYWVIF